jgi:hypothetical protein
VRACKWLAGGWGGGGGAAWTCARARARERMHAYSPESGQKRPSQQHATVLRTSVCVGV